MPDAKDPADAPLIVASAIELSGHNNGICNILLNRVVYVPVANSDGSTRIEAHKVYPADIRFDLFCAQQIHDALGKILDEQTKPKLAS